MSAEIIPFPAKPRRVPVGPHFTAEESAAAVQTSSENVIVHDNILNAWMRFLGVDDGRLGR